MAAATPNSRASLLAGLRTGGVRPPSTSPLTADVNGAVNIPHLAPQTYGAYFSEEESQVLEMPRACQLYGHRAPPSTAPIDGRSDRFFHQQHDLNPNGLPFNPIFQPSEQIKAQAMQMQMLQLEMMKIQVIQAQQYQASAMVRQRQLRASVQNRRMNMTHNASVTAVSPFDQRSATVTAEVRRSNEVEQSKSHFQIEDKEIGTIPMTVVLDGKFGSRSISLSVPPAGFGPQAGSEHDSIPAMTSIISGGTALGRSSSNSGQASGNIPSKSDSVSWRRGSRNNGSSGVASLPLTNITPASYDNQKDPLPRSSPVATTNGKFRPQALQFSPVASQPLPTVTVDYMNNETVPVSPPSHSTSTSTCISSPTTPSSAKSAPLAQREEASKRLYEGLGLGRPLSAVSDASQQHSPQSASHHRMVSQLTRQPRGPPSGADELGPKNFASRIRRKAIGGLSVLLTTRERRETAGSF